MSSFLNTSDFKRIYRYAGMNFKHDTTLACKAAIAAVSSAWYHEEIWKLYDPVLSQYSKHKWQAVQDKIKEGFLMLPITSPAKEQLITIIHPIGIQLQRWFVVHSYLNISDLDLSKLLCWNSQGVIMYKETAERIIETGNASTMNSFVMACNYSIEKHIFRLWPSVEYYFHNSHPPQGTNEVLYWVYYLMDKIDEFMYSFNCFSDLYALVFTLAIHNNNGIFVDYFLEKLDGDKSGLIQTSCQSILINRVRSSYAMIPHFFLKLDALDQISVLSYNSQVILFQFLEWPFHGFFLDVASQIWEQLQPESYYYLFNAMCQLLSEFNHNPMYIAIIEGFWLRMCRPCCREYVIEMCIKATFLRILFTRDKMAYVISLIFQKSTISEKKDMVLSFNGIQTLDYLISQQKWGYVTQFIRECLPLNEMEMFAEVFMQHSKVHSPLIGIKEVDVKFFFDILDSLKSRACVSSNKIS